MTSLRGSRAELDRVVSESADTMSVSASTRTELVATAVANVQARSELLGASQPEVFDQVVVEASRLLGDHATALLRYEPSGDATVVAVHGSPATVGMRVPVEANGVAARVLHSGRAARIDDYAGVLGSARSIAQEIGLGATVGVPIAGAGRPWGMIGATSPNEPLPAATEHRLAQFAELVATAIENAEGRAELTASRVRIIAAADDARRRIQRDLHDGAQQRLAQTIVTLQLAKQALGDAGSPYAELVEEALQNAQQAAADLRALVHGVMPAALVRGGLRPGIESLTRQMDLPVGLDVTAHRLPTPVETTAYFVVAEGLTNVVKHAGAASAHVRAVIAGGSLHLELRDDGAGGADPTRGTGLAGLGDRVAASGGSIAIVSPPGGGTTLTVKLPLEHDRHPDPPHRRPSPVRAQRHCRVAAVSFD